MGGFQNPNCLLGSSHLKRSPPYDNLTDIARKTRRTRIIPYRFLTGLGVNRKGGAIAASPAPLRSSMFQVGRFRHEPMLDHMAGDGKACGAGANPANWPA